MKSILRGRNFISSTVLHKSATLALTSLQYITPIKIINLVRCEAEKRARVVRPRSFPYIAVIDITNTCNLCCPYCPTGDKRESGRKKTIVDPDQVKRLIDEIGKYLITANLFNWGEPLLHPKISTIVEMFHRARIFTVISTNLNNLDKGRLNELCEAGLDFMIISLSGASQEVYETYHRKGKLNLVLENIRHIAAYKKKNRLKNPVIKLKYLVFKHNIQEIEAARRQAKDAGVDIFRHVRAGGPEEAEVKDGSIPERRAALRFCHQLWHMVILNADGGIAPCCFLFFKEDDFGEYSQDGLMELRNNRRFLLARSLFHPSATAYIPRDLEHPCLKCSLVHEQPHLRNYLESNPHAKRGHRTGGP